MMQLIETFNANPWLTFLLNATMKSLGSVDISTEPDKSGDKTTKLRNPK